MKFLKKFVFFILFLMLNIGFSSNATGCENLPISTSEVKKHQIHGEIIAISATQVVIYEKGVNFTLRFGPRIQILCNGLTANWQSLRPITTYAFFEAQAYLNMDNQVEYLSGYYQGEECIIDGWEEGQARLRLYLLSVEQNIFKEIEVNPDARIPKEHWLTKGQLVYVLYNLGGKIRGIYLPD